MQVDGFAHSAGRHGVSKGRARQVIANPTVTLILPAPSPDKDERTVWLGPDSTGRVLEVVTVPSDKGRVRDPRAGHSGPVPPLLRRHRGGGVMDEMRDSKGNLIDDAYVEEALADLDAVEPVAVRRGRPSLSADSRESPRVSFRVPEQLACEVRELSAEFDLSVSTLARVALTEYVERHRSSGGR